MIRVLTMADRPAYVALGDSMSIDDYAGGPGCGAASLLFQNRDTEFPEWAGRDLRSRLRRAAGDASFAPMAMDGATSAAVRYVQLPRLIESGVRPSLVTLTMGGNDLLQTFGRDDAAAAACATLRDHTRAVLEAIRRLSGPDAPIVVSTIYDPSDGTADTQALGIIAWPGVLGWLDCFNETLKAVAAPFDVLIADVHAVFLGHGLATGASPAQADARPAERGLYYCGVVEPNAWGASAIRAAWWEALVDVGFIQGGVIRAHGQA